MEEAEQMQLKAVCPVCGNTELTMKHERCPYDGASLTPFKALVGSGEESLVKKVVAPRQCPKCGLMCTKGKTICTCGTDIIQIPRQCPTCSTRYSKGQYHCDLDGTELEVIEVLEEKEIKKKKSKPEFDDPELSMENQEEDAFVRYWRDSVSVKGTTLFSQHDMKPLIHDPGFLSLLQPADQGVEPGAFPVFDDDEEAAAQRRREAAMAVEAKIEAETRKEWEAVAQRRREAEAAALLAQQRAAEEVLFRESRRLAEQKQQEEEAMQAQMREKARLLLATQERVAAEKRQEAEQQRIAAIQAQQARAKAEAEQQRRELARVAAEEAKRAWAREQQMRLDARRQAK